MWDGEISSQSTGIEFVEKKQEKRDPSIIFRNWDARRAPIAVRCGKGVDRVNRCPDFFGGKKKKERYPRLVVVSRKTIDATATS
jgi:hypothetical protein